jgi:hypothetical protein
MISSGAPRRYPLPEIGECKIHVFSHCAFEGHRYSVCIPLQVIGTAVLGASRPAINIGETCIMLVAEWRTGAMTLDKSK